MIRLSVPALCEEYHKEAYHEAIVLALKELSVGRYIPWKPKRKQKLSDEQLLKEEIQAFFRDLWNEESTYFSLTCGKQADMERVISNAGSKYNALQEPDREGCKNVLESILPYEESFKKAKGFRVKNGRIESIKLSHWGGVEYLGFLRVAVCPYCNNAILSRNTNLQYDHYLEKDKFPYLRLNLYNLVPCCPNCNQYRRKKIEINDFTTYAYPFRDSIDKEAKFDLDFGCLEDMQDNEAPINPQHLQLVKRKEDSPIRSCKFIDEMGLVDEFKKSPEVIRKISDVKRDSFNLHDEVQKFYEGLLGKIGKRRAYSDIFHFPFDRREINRVQDLKICLDMVKIFAPELEIREEEP